MRKEFIVIRVIHYVHGWSAWKFVHLVSQLGQLMVLLMDIILVYKLGRRAGLMTRGNLSINEFHIFYSNRLNTLCNDN